MDSLVRSIKWLTIWPSGKLIDAENEAKKTQRKEEEEEKKKQQAEQSNLLPNHMSIWTWPTFKWHLTGCVNIVFFILNWLTNSLFFFIFFFYINKCNSCLLLLLMVFFVYCSQLTVCGDVLLLLLLFFFFISFHYPQLICTTANFHIVNVQHTSMSFHIFLCCKWNTQQHVSN